MSVAGAAAASAPATAWIEQPMAVLAVLLAVLAALFGAERTGPGGRLFRAVPLLVFCYFVPALLSNVGVIPSASPLFSFVKSYLLPASLVLMVLATDIPAVLSLGRDAVVLFLAGTASVVIGGPLAFLALGWAIPDAAVAEAWKGLAALSGSWIGGGANFVAVGESVGASDTILALMVVVDVAAANLWMAVLLWFSGREAKMDAAIGADRSRLDAVRERVERYQLALVRPSTLPDLLQIAAIGFGATVVAHALADLLPEIGTIVNRFTWVVSIATAAGLALSFTPARRLEGAGASKIGSVFLYLLVASIGAGARFDRITENLPLLAIGLLWIAIHGAVVLAVRRWLRAPIFFAAVGSQANIGGAASAPVVAAAFHPALAPVGVLLAILGYVLGTYGGLVTAVLLQRVAAVHGG